MQTRGSAYVRRTIPTYTAEPTSIQDKPSPEIIHNAVEIAQLGGADINSLQEIPDEDDSKATEDDRGADHSPSDTVSLQVEEKPHNLHIPDHRVDHMEVDVDAHLPDTDHNTDRHAGDVAKDVLGCGNGDCTNEDRKIVADVNTPSGVVANGPEPNAHEVRGGVESSGVYVFRIFHSEVSHSRCDIQRSEVNQQNKVMVCLFL